MKITVDTKLLWIAWFIISILKLMDIIDWSWWIIFLPMIAAIVIINNPRM